MAMAATRIIIGPRVRACINCTQYRKYLRENLVPGEVYVTATPIHFGYCVLHERQCGALRNPCKDYENQNKEDNE